MPGVLADRKRSPHNLSIIRLCDYPADAVTQIAGVLALPGDVGVDEVPSQRRVEGIADDEVRLLHRLR